MSSPTETEQTELSEQTFRVELETLEGLRTIACGVEEYVWDAAARHGIKLPAICHQGRCLTCAGRLIKGSVDQRDAEMYFPEDEVAGFVLLCRARPLSDLRIRTHQQLEMREHRIALGLPAPYA